MTEINANGRTIDLCQKILRFSTGIILASFVLIIIVTTISTDDWVLWMGKALYYIIVLQALVSLATWYYRTQLEKGTKQTEGDSGD